MANPSSKYVLEDTTMSGLVCKRTTQAVKDIYPIYSELDNSIAYTKPKNSKYTKMTNMLLPSTFPQRAYDRTNYLQNHYYSNSAHTNQAWSTLGQIIGNNNGDTSVLLNWAFATDDTEYMFNGSQGTSVIGNGNQRFITDFDISHVIFTYGIKGYTKTAFDAWLAGGSAPSVIDITIKQLIDNPDDYYVYRFGMSSRVVWDSDNSQWANATGVINPTCLIDGGDDIQGIERPSHVFGYKMGTASGDYSGGVNADNYKLYSASQNYSISDSTQYIRKGGIPYGLVANNSYGIGSSPSEWIMKPQWTVEACEQHLASLSAAETDQALNPQLFYDNGFVQIYGSDLFSASANYTGAPQGEFHYTKWNKRNSFVTKGSVVCEFLATIGAYFFVESEIAADTLNNDGITPDTLSNVPSIGLGVMNADGTTEGRWVVGRDIDDYDGINKKGSVVHPNFNPSGGGGGGDDDDPSDDQSWGGAYSGAGVFSKFYLCTATDLANLRAWFGGGGGGDQIPDGFDPMGQILGLLQYPVSISGTALSPDEIVFRSGKTIVHTGVNADRSTGGFLHIDCGSVDIPRRMQERGVPFLDFETSLEIYVPFCGTAPLDVQTCVGKTLTCDMYVATATGDVSAVIAAGGHPVAYMSGNMAESLPISSSGYGMYLAACKSTWGNGVTQVMNQITGGTTSTIKNVNQAALNETLSYGQTGGWGQSELLAESYNNPAVGRGMAKAASPSGVAKMGLTTTALNVMNAAATGYEQYQRVKNASYTSVSGSFTSCAAWNYPFTPYVKITRPHKQIPEGGHGDYKHTAGIPLVETRTLSGAPGLTTCVNPDVSGISNATAQEKDIIYRALVNGVIV